MTIPWDFLTLFYLKIKIGGQLINIHEVTEVRGISLEFHDGVNNTVLIDIHEVTVFFGVTLDRVSVPSPIAIDILLDTMARDRAHMYLFSV